MNKFYSLIILALIGFGTRAQDPQGFFLDDFQQKSITSPAFIDGTKPTKANTAFVNINFTNVITPVSKYLFGNNANVYMSQMVDQPVLIDHIKKLSPNVIRFPGGNLSSVYFWNAATKADLPADVPEFILDAAGAVAGGSFPYWYGGNSVNWTLKLDNYYEMLEMTSSTGIITINYPYARYSKASNPVAAAAHLAAEWVRYDNGRTKFWEIGNECNGTWQAGYRIKTSDNHDGQPEIITGALYGEHFKVFTDSMRAAAAEVGATIYIGAQLLQEEPASWATQTDKTWNTGVFQKAGNDPDFYIIHSYYTPYATNSTPDQILNTAVPVTTDMMTYVTNAMANAGVANKPVALTEWNIFAEGSKQQVSYINGMHAAIVLGELIRNKYGQSTRWDLANGYGTGPTAGNDHGMFSQGDEPDNATKWNPRPVFYYMYYFQKYFGDRMVNSTVSGNSDILAYASKFESGQSGIVVINKGSSEQTVSINIQNFGYGERYYVYTLTGGTDNGEFSRKVSVNGLGTPLASGGPPNVVTIKAKGILIGDGVKISAPARSVSYILVENGENVVTEIGSDVLLSVKVHPNPAVDSFTVDFPANVFTTLKMLDTQGKTILTEKIGPSQTSANITTSQKHSVYFISLIGEKKSVVKKIIMR